MVDCSFSLNSSLQYRTTSDVLPTRPVQSPRGQCERTPREGYACDDHTTQTPRPRSHSGRTSDGGGAWSEELTFAQQHYLQAQAVHGNARPAASGKHPPALPSPRAALPPLPQQATLRPRASSSSRRSVVQRRVVRRSRRQRSPSPARPQLPSQWMNTQCIDHSNHNLAASLRRDPTEWYDFPVQNTEKVEEKHAPAPGFCV
jgi:hypothetical protein